MWKKENEEQIESLEEKFREIKLQDEFIELTTGGGKNSPGPLNDRIQYIAEELDSFL